MAFLSRWLPLRGRERRGVGGAGRAQQRARPRPVRSPASAGIVTVWEGDTAVSRLRRTLRDEVVALAAVTVLTALLVRSAWTLTRRLDRRPRVRCVDRSIAAQVAPFLAVGGLLALGSARSLNSRTLGDDVAHSLGVRVRVACCHLGGLDRTSLRTAVYGGGTHRCAGPSRMWHERSPGPTTGDSPRSRWSSPPFCCSARHRRPGVGLGLRRRPREPPETPHPAHQSRTHWQARHLRPPTSPPLTQAEDPAPLLLPVSTQTRHHTGTEDGLT